MTPGECFEALVALQDRLLAPGGCPWDREQTHESLRTYLIEEAYEVLEALDAKDFEKLPEEFGDLLLQVVFHAALAKRAGKFDIRDVVERIHTKLVRRHPHVFGSVKAETAGAVLKNWEQLKAAERAEMNGTASPQAESLLDGVPKSLPALLEAYQLTKRAAKIGFDWDDIEGLLEKLNEETSELRATLPPHEDQGALARREEEVGDLLFVAVNVARFLGVDPEIALKAANRKFSARFRSMEEEMRRRGAKLADASREEMEQLWERSKRV
jgi:MazG family protein